MQNRSEKPFILMAGIFSVTQNMKHKFKIGLYEKDPFMLVSENFQNRMKKIHGSWWTGVDDRIHTRISHPGETRYALRVYPDEPNSCERDDFLKDKLSFFCVSPKDRTTKFKFSGFWEANNFYAETTELLDYDIHNVYKFDVGELNGLYFSYAVIDLEQVYEIFWENLFVAAEDVLDKKMYKEYFDNVGDDSKLLRELINTLHFLNPSLDFYKNEVSDCALIDEIAYPLFKSKVSFVTSNKNYENLSLDEMIYEKSNRLYFVFETGFFINNAKNGVFKRFIIEDNSQKIIRKQYKDDVLKEESSFDFKINNNPHFYNYNF